MSSPRIAASFELDPTGTPSAIREGATKHYRIKLQVLDAPEDAYAVTYQLHESYYDPVRESLDKSSAFSQEVTSYGDYTLQAKVRTKQGVLTVATPLSSALAQGHSSSMSEAVRTALDEIKAK